MQTVDDLLKKLKGFYKAGYPLQISKDVLNLLEKESYTDSEKKFIVEFVEKGLFNRIIELGIFNPEIISNIIEIRKHYQFNDGIRKKAPELISFLDKTNNDFIVDMIDLIVDQYGGSISTFEKERMLTDFLNSGLEYNNIESIISIIQKVTDRFRLKYLRKNSFYNIILKELELDKNSLVELNDRSKGAEKRINNVKEFIKGYIFNALLRGEKLDLDNDELLKKFPDLQEKFKDVKTPKKGEKISIDTLSFINDKIAQIIKNAHETPNYIFSENEKNILNQYFKKYYRISVERFSELERGGHVEIFKQLAIVYKYKFNLEKTNDEFFQLFKWRKFENDLVKTNSDTALNLLADISLKKISVFLKYISDHSNTQENPYESECITTFIRNIIDRHALKNKKDITNKHYQLIIEYVDSITQKANFNIFTEQYISDIIQLSYSKSIPDKIRKKLNDILERNLHVSKIDSESEKKFSNDFIENNGIVTDEKILDEFFSHLGKIKLYDEKIDIKYVKFVIMQVLDQNSAICKNPEKYEIYLERIIEELGRNDLLLKTSSENHCYFVRDYLRDNATSGQIINNTITIKRCEIDKLMKNKNINVILFLFHENTHAKQKQDMNQENGIDYYKYLMLKEMIIRNYSEDYYTLNYWEMFEEIEAREQGAANSIKFLESIVALLSENERKSCCDTLMNSLFGELEELVKKEKRNYKSATTKIDTIEPYEELREIESIFDNLLLTHPEILTNPQYQGLLREYNQDGTKKRISQILPEVEQTKGNKDLHLYMNILSRGNIFQPSNFVEDLQFLIGHENADKRSCWINSEILNHLLLHVVDNINLIPSEQLPEFVKIIDELKVKTDEIERKPEEQRSYTDKKIYMAIGRKDKEKDKPIIEILSDTRQRLIDEGKVSILDKEQSDAKNEQDIIESHEEKDESNRDNDEEPPEMQVFHEAERQTSHYQKVIVLQELITSAEKNNLKDNKSIPRQEENDEITRT